MKLLPAAANTTGSAESCVLPSFWSSMPNLAPLAANQSKLRLGERLLHIAEAIEVQIGVGAIALHGDDLQVAAKVARVEAGDGQAIAVAGEYRRPVCALPAVIHLRQR